MDWMVTNGFFVEPQNSMVFFLLFFFFFFFFFTTKKSIFQQVVVMVVVVVVVVVGSCQTIGKTVESVKFKIKNSSLPKNEYIIIHMDVSENSGTPKSSI